MSESNVIQLRPREEPKGLPITKLKEYFRTAEEAHQEPRKLSFRDRDYYDNYDDNQWTDYEKSQLKKRRQQIATSNRIKGKVNATLFYVENARSDPTAFPLTPGMEGATNIAEDALDYVERNTNFDDIEWNCAFDLAWAGAEAVEITLNPDTNDIDIEPISYERFFYDPRSLKKDFTDARYLGYCEWMDQDVALARYPEAEDIIHSTADEIGAYDEGYEDKPYGVYSLKDQQRLRVVVMYYRRPDGVWMLTHFTGSGVLFEEESPWPDEHGNAPGIIAQSLYRTRDGKIFGQIRDWISPQNEINQRKSKSLHLLSDRRTWGLEGWTKDENQAKEALARPDGHLPVTMPKEQGWGLLDSTAEIQGNFELLQQAIGDIELGGQYISGDKQRAQDQSGVALQRLQMAGLSQDAPFFKAHKAWKIRVYRRMWFMVKKFWTGPRALPILGGDEPRFLMINEPAGIDPASGMPVVRNPISQIDVDFILDAGPEMMSLPQEEYELLKEIAQVMGSYPPPVVMVLVEASNLRKNTKEKIMGLLQQMMQPPPPDPLAQHAAMADVENTQADTQKKVMETAVMYAEAQAGPERKNEF